MLSHEKKKEIIQLIIASDSLKNAPTSIALLKYLLDAHLENRPLKEGVIDIEFYGSDVDANKNNPRVRVNIYNLRNKLEKYYADQGSQDEWQVHIEKGQYNLKFKKRNEKGNRRYHLKTVIPYLIAALAVISLLLTYWPKKASKIWSAFFNNGHNTNLFIGDAFGYSGKTAFGNSGWTRDYSVNNLEEFYQMLEKNPDLKNQLSPTEFTYATRMAENATHDLSRFFTEWQSDFNIKYATQTSFTDIKKENTIYVGRLKDQTNFVYLFNEANPHFQLKNEAIYLKGHPTLRDTIIPLKSNYKSADYAIVSRIKGPNNTEQFLFFSDHDIGVMSTVEYFTNAESLKAFTEEHLSASPYFTAVFLAKGKHRINLDLEQLMVVSLERAD